MRALRLAVATALLGCAGCGAGPAGPATAALGLPAASTAAPRTSGATPAPAAPAFGDVVVVPARAPGTPPPVPQATARVLFLAFDGVAVGPGSDDAIAGTSSLVSQAVSIPAFSAMVSAPSVTAAAARRAVVDRVRALYLPYAVTVVDQRPANGPYTMVVVGGSHTALGQPTGVAGLSPLDCADTSLSDIGFAFAADFAPRYGGVVGLALTAAHEAGHTFGLEHVDAPRDPMYAVDPATGAQRLPDLFQQAFSTSASYSSYQAGGASKAEACGRTDPLDDDALLTAALGPRDPATLAGDAAPPTLSWTHPAAAAAPDQATMVGTSVLVQASATDDVGPVRLEVYKNLDLVAAPAPTEPVAVSVAAADGETFYLTVEAIDNVGRRTAETRLYQASAALPADCGPAKECAAGYACRNGSCLLAIGADCLAASECASNLCSDVRMDHSSICTAMCTTSCASNTERCTQGWCVPLKATRAPGQSCLDDLECLVGTCTNGVCVEPCTCASPGAHCNSMGVCVYTNDPGGNNGCAVAPHGTSSAPVVLLLVGLVALLARRRTRRAA